MSEVSESRRPSTYCASDEGVVTDEFLHCAAEPVPGFLNWERPVKLLCGSKSARILSHSGWETANYTAADRFVSAQEPIRFLGPEDPYYYFKGKCPECEKNQDLPLVFLADYGSEGTCEIASLGHGKNK